MVDIIIDNNRAISRLCVLPLEDWIIICLSYLKGPVCLRQSKLQLFLKLGIIIR